MKAFKYILPLFALLAVTSCQQDDDIAISDISLNLDLALPVSQSTESRTLGDPGIDEEFLKPTVLWVFLVADQGSEHFVYAVRYSTAESEWTLSADNKTLYFSDNRIVNFEGLDLRKNPDIRAYLLASHDVFSFDRALVAPAADYQATRQTIDENMLTHISINAMYGANYISLRDIYSTPYNLTTSWGDMNKKGGTYYGTVDKRYYEAGVVNVSDTLYHVAAKADFQWNPETSNLQPNVVRGIVLKNLPTKGYAFRPTENPSGIATYSKLLLGTFAADDQSDATEVNPGNQWSGRAYTFMFQPANNVLNYTFTTRNNAAQGGYQGVANPANVVNSANAGVFASWYKIDHDISDSTIEE